LDQLWKILLAAVILLLIFSYRQFILKRENKRLEEAYKVLQNQKRELKGQKKIYELIFDNAMDGVLILDNGRFTDCNQSIVKMLRCDKKEDLLNVHPAQLSPERQPDGRLSFEKANEMITLAYKNRGHRFEWMHRKATGEDFYCEIVLTPVPLDNREILHVVWRDISERKKLENENAAIRKRMEMAFDGSRDGLWDWDLINDTVYFSPRWKEMIGYGEDELENSFDTWQERVHPDDLEQVLKNAQLSLNDETVAYENKHRLRHKDGHWVWIYDRGKVQFNDEGKAIRMIGTHTDLTTEINLTTELKELNQTLEEKIDIVIKDLKKSQQQAKLGSWKHNIADHKLTWSDETYYIFELEKRSEIASYENFLAAIHPDDIEKVKTAYAHSLKTQEPYQIRHRIIMADGRIKYVKEHCETTFDSSGNALVSIGTIQDITKEYLDAEKLREKENMLFKQSRLAQMGEMINMIAHQWRQPLSAISATTNTLILKNERGVYESELFEDRLQKIANYSQHLSTTIDDFRNFFKTHKEKEETTLEVVIKDIVYMIQPLLENNSINIVTDFKYNKKVNIYSNELKQVLLNLIKNAEDVLIENKIVGPEITIRTFNEDDYAVLSIEDNGGGIDNAIIDKIFDPYFSTKLDKEGTGLGLYMSKIIVQEHCAGILTVENDFKGAVFKIKMKGKEILECS
jgi:PAS domain S-box-containing protein